MSEIEAPMETATESIHEAVESAREKWVGRVALYSALVAAIAAVSAMLAGHHSDEAMILQIKASDQWSYYQAKGVKAAIADLRANLLADAKSSEQERNSKTAEQYKEEQKEISTEAKKLESESSLHLELHAILARAVTCFQVAIAIAAISVLTKRRRFWYVSIAFSLVGLWFFCEGVLRHS